MNILRSFIEDFKAWRRGETRVAPRKLTGRVYAPKKQPKAGGFQTRAKGELVLKRRVYRAETDTWEPLPELRTKL